MRGHIPLAVMKAAIDVWFLVHDQCFDHDKPGIR